MMKEDNEKKGTIGKGMRNRSMKKRRKGGRVD